MPNKEKPWITPEEQVQQLKDKGVKFVLMSEQDAQAYLSGHNNYFRLRSYRVGFPKHVGGEFDGRYVNLDFAMLKDLSIIDMRLRNELLPITLDIEHFYKLRLLNVMEAHHEDGYSVVREFIAQDDCEDDSGHKRNRILDEIKRGMSSPYTRGLIERHPKGDFPAWEFMEVIPFGRFIHFWKFCAARYSDRRMTNDFYMLQSVKGLRNCCAHNNCVINDMRTGEVSHEVRHEVMESMSTAGIGHDTRQTKMQNERFIQIATTLHLHQKVASDGVRVGRGKSLHDLVGRIDRHLDYYAKDTIIGSGLRFIIQLIECWYPDSDQKIS